MKVIDLLNKIANGEEVPKKIKVLDVVYEFDDHYGDYYNKSLDRFLFVYMTSEEEWKLAYFLNTKVEIIEDKKIEKIDLSDWIEITTKGDLEEETFTKIFNKNATTFVNKINEIIEHINNGDDKE